MIMKKIQAMTSTNPEKKKSITANSEQISNRYIMKTRANANMNKCGKQESKIFFTKRRREVIKRFLKI